MRHHRNHYTIPNWGFADGKNPTHVLFIIMIYLSMIIIANMTNRVYGTRVKIGNWSEDLSLQEDALKDYMEKKEKGELAAQKIDFLKENILRPVTLAVTRDGGLHFGDVVMLVNMGGEKREWSTLSINADINGFTKIPSPGLRAPCGVSAGPGLQPCARTAFVITSVDGSPEESPLHYEQSFALKTTSGFARGCAKKSRLQEVNLVDNDSFLSWWRIVYFDPQERLEYEGQRVPANVKVLIIHCKTNQALAVLHDQVLWTTYGKEYEVTAHTFLDSHKAEQDNNHWILCTSDPGGEGLALLIGGQLAAGSLELPEANEGTQM